jgi:hypothetical protein
MMSNFYAPPWALVAQALAAKADTHLPDGVHLRVAPLGPLGIPATPLFIYRTVLNAGQIKERATKSAMRWYDKAMNLITEPFTLTPGNEIIGEFLEPNVIWAQLRYLAGSDQGGLVFEELVSTTRGLSAIQSRNKNPYVFASAEMRTVRLSGNGKILGMMYMTDEQLKEAAHEKPWAVWSLPLAQAAPRYVPTANAVAEALRRVQDAAVTRQPLHVAFGAVSAGASPPASGPSINGLIDSQLI